MMRTRSVTHEEETKAKQVSDVANSIPGAHLDDNGVLFVNTANTGFQQLALPTQALPELALPELALPALYIHDVTCTPKRQRKQTEAGTVKKKQKPLN